MPKVIFSSVGRFSGAVTLSDPLTFPQKFALEDANKVAIGLGETTQSRLNYALLPGICACVEKWELEGLPEDITPDNFPATPPVASAELVAWLLEEITLLYTEAEAVPNE